MRQPLMLGMFASVEGMTVLRRIKILKLLFWTTCLGVPTVQGYIENSTSDKLKEICIIYLRLYRKLLSLDHTTVSP